MSETKATAGAGKHQVRGVDFVFYNVTDFAKSMTFYRDVLGLKATQVTEGQWAEFQTGADTSSVTLAIGVFGGKAGDPKDKDNVSAYLAVTDVAASVEYLKGKGVPIVHEPMDTAGCSMAIVADPDGNQIGLHHRKDGSFA
jgi:predicted enzyme related to lactoylglutathione lyase